MSMKPVDTAVELMVGPCIDDTDFKTRESIAYDGAGADVSLFEEVTAGLTVTALTLTAAGAQDWIDEGEGYHSVEVTAAQNNNEGVIWAGGIFTGVLPFESPHYDCVPTKVYNSFVAGSDNLEVDLIQINGAAQTATLDDIEGQTDDIGAAGAGLTAIPWNAGWDAEVQSEVDDALKALGLDHLVSAAVAGADVADNSIIAKMVASGATADWDTFVNTTESLQALRDHIGDGTNLTEAGGTGNHLTAIPWNAAWDGEVQSEVNDALVAFFTSMAALVDAIWDEDIVAAHSTADTAGLLLRALGAVISQRTNNATLNALLGVTDAAGDDLSEQVWAEGTRVLTAGTNLNDISVSDILTAALADAYAANGVAPTLQQAVMAIHQGLFDFSITTTTVTVEKLGGTTAFLVTLDDAANPTAAHRA